MKQTRIAALVLACAALTACNADAPFGPHDEHATMRIATGGATPTVIGETVAITATVMGPTGEPLQDAAIHWGLSEAGVLESLGNGRFRVIREGTVQVAAVWPSDPSVRAIIAVTVDAGLLASACITKSDQATTAASRCAATRVVVRMAPSAPSNAALDGRAALQLPATVGGTR